MRKAHDHGSEKWYFDLLGPRQDVWVWRRMSDEGALVAMSSQQFRYYLDCVADAEKHGYPGTPSFRSPQKGPRAPS